MADPTVAEFITSLKEALYNSKGASSIRHPDGRTLTYSRKELMAELSYWETKSTAYRIDQMRYRNQMSSDS